jgi:hypothetical protein
VNEQLNDRVKKELQDILDPPEQRAARQMEAMTKHIWSGQSGTTQTHYELMAVHYAKSLDDMPACFWIKLFEIAQEMTNPVLHTLNCTNWVSADEKCKAGYEMSECRHSCQNYEGEKADYSDDTICDGNCAGHDGAPSDGAGEYYA